MSMFFMYNAADSRPQNGTGTRKPVQEAKEFSLFNHDIAVIL